MEKWREQPSRFACVIDQHPGQAALVRRLLVSNNEFRELCEDYLLLREMTAELKARTAPTEQEVRAEYAQLALDLENEIARALSRHAAPTAH